MMHIWIIMDLNAYDVDIRTRIPQINQWIVFAIIAKIGVVRARKRTGKLWISGGLPKKATRPTIDD